VLPLVHVRSPIFGKSLVSVGFGVYGGIVAEDDATTQALADDAARLGESLGVDHVELRQIGERNLGWTQKSDLYVTFCRALAPSSDANLKAIPRKNAPISGRRSTIASSRSRSAPISTRSTASIPRACAISARR